MALGRKIRTNLDRIHRVRQAAGAKRANQRARSQRGVFFHVHALHELALGGEVEEEGAKMSRKGKILYLQVIT